VKLLSEKRPASPLSNNNGINGRKKNKRSNSIVGA